MALKSKLVVFQGFSLQIMYKVIEIAPKLKEVITRIFRENDPDIKLIELND